MLAASSTWLLGRRLCWPPPLLVTVSPWLLLFAVAATTKDKHNRRQHRVCDDDPEAQKLTPDGVTCYPEGLFAFNIFRGLSTSRVTAAGVSGVDRASKHVAHSHISASTPSVDTQLVHQTRDARGGGQASGSDDGLPRLGVILIDPWWCLSRNNRRSAAYSASVKTKRLT